MRNTRHACTSHELRGTRKENGDEMDRAVRGGTEGGGMHPLAPPWTSGNHGEWVRDKNYLGGDTANRLGLGGLGAANVGADSEHCDFCK